MRTAQTDTRRWTGHSAAAGPHEQVTRWIEGARREDRESIGSLFRYYVPHVERYVVRTMGACARRWIDPEALASEATYETIIGLKTLPVGAGMEEVRARLLRTAKCRMYDVIRKHRFEVGESRRPPETAGGAVEQARELSTWLRGLVTEMRARSREVIRLCGLQGFTYEQAGRQLGVPPEAVRKRYKVACSELKRRCERTFT